MRRIRTALDIAMTLVLLLLMAYSLIGELFHEIVGTLMLVLFVLHHVLNRRWYPSLFKGKYPARRMIMTILDMLLLVVMVLQPASGILMSKYLYLFLPVSGLSATVREVHLMISCWGFVLMSIHAGMHLYSPVRKLRKKSRRAGIVVSAVCAAVSGYGVYAFVKRLFPDYMFRRTVFAFFDFSEPRVLFFLDYVAIMFLFATAGLLIMKILILDRRDLKSIKEILGN